MTTVHNVRPDLLPLLTPIGGVRPHPENARNGDLEAITASLQTFGQYAPVVAQDSTHRILKGNHVYASALGLDWTHLAVTWLDVDDETATRILLADNRSSDLGRYDDPALAALLLGLPTLDGTLYTGDDLAKLLAKIEADERRPLGEDDPAAPDVEPTALVYALLFDTPGQQTRWRAYLKWLQVAGYDGETVAERIHSHLAFVLGDLMPAGLA